jgi:hypothetical protein
LETGLRLAAPALASGPERAALLAQLAATASALLGTHEPAPRLVAAAARVFIAARQPEKAAALVETLPAGSPLQAELLHTARFALHQKRAASMTAPARSWPGETPAPAAI